MDEKEAVKAGIMSPKLKFVKIVEHATIPSYQTKGAAGMDLHAVNREILKSGETKLIDTGLKVQIPEGFEGQVRPRSGLAAKHGITVLNAPGTIDSDYRGELKVILHNTSDKDFEIMCPDRIAQFVIAPVAQLEVERVENLDNTERGSGGFGSTGK